MKSQLNPDQVCTEAAEDLFRLSTRAQQDSMTLIKIARMLLDKKKVGRARGMLRRYTDQYGCQTLVYAKDQVAGVLATLDPDHAVRTAKLQANREIRIRGELNAPQGDIVSRPEIQSNVVAGPWNEAG